MHYPVNLIRFFEGSMLYRRCHRWHSAALRQFWGHIPNAGEYLNLRHASIDELPQLCWLLRGEMSLVDLQRLYKTLPAVPGRRGAY